MKAASDRRKVVREEGVKFDTAKPRTDLLPPGPLLAVSDVLTFGAQKYSAWNWARGMAWSRVYGATLRHLFAFWRGEDLDPETGLPHVDHALCCLLFLSEYAHEARYAAHDDRFRPDAGGAQS